ncbi:MAG: DUF488 domain-containing protein [Rothia dentocariosa]|jgi:transcriptional regulator, MarR family
MDIVIKRIYEEPSPDDGYRVLVDRLWPRGVSKDKAHLDEWAKDLAPSTEARRDFGHKPENFESFKQRYLNELDSNAEVHPELERMVAGAQKLQPSRVTLLYGAKSPTCNHAIILRDYLIDQLKSL